MLVKIEVTSQKESSASEFLPLVEMLTNLQKFADSDGDCEDEDSNDDVGDDDDDGGDGGDDRGNKGQLGRCRDADTLPTVTL